MFTRLQSRSSLDLPSYRGRGKMWPTVWLAMLAGWSCFPPTVKSQQPAITRYVKVGDNVVLEPNVTVTQPITSIKWKDGPNIAILWEDSDPEPVIYRHFKGCSSLNISSGVVTITGVTRDFSVAYTPEINDIKGTQIDLRVISPVPVPTVTQSCDEALTSCTLTCEGNTADAEAVTYKWKSDNTELAVSSKEHHIKKEESEKIGEFSCELSNPVSLETSKPINNPFITLKSGLNINSGLTVFICLLTLVVLLVLIHRWKAGMWFFNKESLPWEADFWRRNANPRRDAVGSNGVTAHQEQRQGDEETPMTDAKQR
ncbi:uncharacterized protein [Trachinotus anak]|uniref:uncharacterized protein n=1 Tax=Trachinotus anak TaxID=443729 RepID=UPI0039F17D27